MQNVMVKLDGEDEPLTISEYLALPVEVTSRSKATLVYADGSEVAQCDEESKAG
jgi:hypothetical protein